MLEKAVLWEVRFPWHFLPITLFIQGFACGFLHKKKKSLWSCRRQPATGILFFGTNIVYSTKRSFVRPCFLRVTSSLCRVEGEPLNSLRPILDADEYHHVWRPCRQIAIIIHVQSGVPPGCRKALFCTTQTPGTPQLLTLGGMANVF